MKWFRRTWSTTEARRMKTTQISSWNRTLVRHSTPVLSVQGGLVVPLLSGGDGHQSDCRRKSSDGAEVGLCRARRVESTLHTQPQKATQVSRATGKNSVESLIKIVL